MVSIFRIIRCKLFLFILFILFLFAFTAAPGFAQEYWVSSTGKAAWADCYSDVPLNGIDCCSLLTANKNAKAGEIVNLRAGTYGTSIFPANSGIPGSVITFQAYNMETVIIQNVTAIMLKDNDYIRVDGVDGLDAGTGGYNVVSIEHGSSYNEISNGHFYRTGEPWTRGYSLLSLRFSGTDGQFCIHNWIHDNEMHDSGSLEWVGSECNDAGRLITIGSSFDGDSESNYNTLENNHLYHGGHHILEVETSYNVIRNNVIHNECWMGNFNDMPNKSYRDCSTSSHSGCEECGESDDRYKKYGGRGVFFSNKNGSNCLLEGNRIGFSGRPPDDAGANNIVTRMPYVIIRYNYSFGASSTGIYLRDGVDNNAVYNNTVYYNGQLDNGTPFGSANFAGIALVSSDAIGNQVVNNIVYDNKFDWDGAYKTRWINTQLRGNWCTNNEPDFCDGYGDPKFTETSLTWWQDPKYTATRPDLTLLSDSPCIDRGSFLTRSIGSGSNSTKLFVLDAKFFQDGSMGSSLSDIQPDWIAIGTIKNVVQISSINYSTNTIILKSPMSWDNNSPIYLYKKSDGVVVLLGNAPDIGASESTFSKILKPPMNLHLYD